jgi:hypothetical protein
MMVRHLPAIALLLLTACAARVDLQEPAAPPAQVAVPAVSTVHPVPDPARTLYLCDTGQAVVVQDEGDTVRVSGLPRGEERLGRDAGGLTPQQAVFSGPTLRVEFGLGTDGREISLQSFFPPQVMSCKPG